MATKVNATSRKYWINLLIKIREKAICNGNIAVQNTLGLNNSVKRVHASIWALSECICSVFTGYLQIVEIAKNHLIIFAATSVHHKKLAANPFILVANVGKTDKTNGFKGISSY